MRPAMQFVLVLIAFSHSLTVLSSTKTDSLYKQLSIANAPIDSAKILYNLAWYEYNEQQYSKSIELGKTTATYCELKNEDSLAILSYRFIGAIFGTIKNIDSSIVYIQKGLHIASKIKDTLNIGLLNSMLGALHTYKANYPDALLSYDLSDSIYLKLQYYNGLAFNAIARGKTFSELGLHSKSLQWYYKSKVYEEKFSSIPSVSLMENIAAVYEKIEQFSQAKEIYLNIIQHYSDGKYTKTHYLAETYVNLGLLYGNMGQKDSSLYFMRKGMNMFQTLNLQHDVQSSLFSLSKFYLKENRLDSSLYYANKMNTALLLPKLNADLLMQKAIIYKKLNQPKTALNYAQKALKKSQQYGLFELQKEALEFLIGLHNELSQPEKAASYISNLQVVTDTLNEKSSLLETQRLMMEQTLMEKELVLNKEKISHSSSKKLWLSIAFVLLTISMVVVYFFGKEKSKRKKENSKHQKEKTTINTSKILLKNELDNTTKAYHELQEKLKYKNKEIEDMALSILHKNKILQQTKNNIQGANKKLQNPELNEAVISMKNSLAIEKDEEELYNHIEQINDLFYYKIKQKFPDLSDYDLRLCALIRIKLSSKDIATIMNISPKSVDMSRYRLRKKFGLNKNDDFQVVFKSL